jgi:phosphoglycolate phosphatase-like HAD superfamily hydrolase
VTAPSLLALDFDGVVCDGLEEYFESAWRTHALLWGSPADVPPPGLAERFYALRPLIESGWEMPLLVKALLAGAGDAHIREEWPTLAPKLLAGRPAAEVGTRLDRVRDDWIAADHAGWLGRHRFYPGVVDRLRALAGGTTRPVIITTKEGRFARELLARQGLDLSPEGIYGKETRRPKADVLRALRTAGGRIWFVEDRLQTLEAVAGQTDLDDVRLFLAGWGYNFASERERARASRRITLLSLEEFTHDCTVWPGA